MKESSKNIWIQPASGDAGNAVGAALAFWYSIMNSTRKVEVKDSMKGSFLGPAFDDVTIERCLTEAGGVFSKHSSSSLIKYVVDALISGKAVGWVQGRMEFGPRALGARSILADPRSSTMQRDLNLKVKFRESFKPFAPSILEEYLSDWFDIDCANPYMLVVAKIKESKRIARLGEHEQLSGIDKLNIPRSLVPAVIHIDFSVRVQSVSRRHNPMFYELINPFCEETGCPVLINTSFNVRGEPIVLSSNDAFRCFMGCGLDLSAVGSFILEKEDQSIDNELDCRSKYELD